MKRKGSRSPGTSIGKTKYTSLRGLFFRPNFLDELARKRLLGRLRSPSEEHPTFHLRDKLNAELQWREKCDVTLPW